MLAVRELIVECHTQVPSSLGGGYHRVVNEVNMISIKRKAGRKSKPPSQRVASDVVSLDDVAVKGTNKEAATEIQALRKMWRGAGEVEPLDDDTVKCTKKEAATEIKTLRKRQRVAGDVEPLDDVAVKGTKKEATTEIETPRKRRRVARDVEPLDNVTVKGTNKKVATEIRTLRNRRRGATDVEPLDDETSKGTNNEAATEKETLHEKQSDGNNGNKINTGFQQSEFTPLMGHTNIDHFKAEYMQLHRIGKGSFGDVYAGTRRSDELPVAIKYVCASSMSQILLRYNGTQSWYPMEVILMLKAAGGPESLGKYAAVSLLDWYHLGKKVVMVMERPSPCVTLIKYCALRIDPLKEMKAKVIMKQLVEAAIDLHAKNVFHRDLKPGNILIEFGPDGLRVRVIDFGCGCFLRNIRYTAICGTPDYLPPEVFLRKEYMGLPTTVWQLGAMLFKMLSENRGFSTKGFLRKDIEILTVWSQDCQDLLKRCLAIDPCERPSLYQIREHPWFD
nr:PREDICTED: serine/threonine-protein kinase pim-2-like [Paralichthys olivaceus]